MIVLDTQDAATYAGVTPRTVERWVKAGRLSNRGSGWRILVALDDLDSILAKAAMSGK